MRRPASLRNACLVSVLALGVASFVPADANQDTTMAGDWLEFHGSWSASGRRQSVATEGGGVATTITISGAVVLTAGEGLARGYSAEAIGFDDGHGTSVGRCVWTDDKGDRIFSSLKGEQVQTGKRAIGTITGGTGRYVGIEGEYSLTWQFVVPAEDDVIQGRTVSLAGRVRRAGEP